MEAKNLNDYIKKSHVKMVEKFNSELEAFAKETEAEAAELYENAYTTFTLANVKLENGWLTYEYDGKPDAERMVYKDDEDGQYHEDDLDGIAEWIKFWRSCLRRAKRYWSMDTEKLDAIQSGDAEDDTEDEE